MEPLGSLAWMPGKPALVFGAQAGSEGKGALCAWLARDYGYRASVTASGPNSGHVVRLDHGQMPHVFKNIPVASLWSGTRCFIGPGSFFVPLHLIAEWVHHGRPFLHVHARATTIRADDATTERGWHLESCIGSTCTGTGAALSRKVRRVGWQEASLGELLDLVPARAQADRLNLWVDDHHWAPLEESNLLVQGYQGLELDPDYGYEYPYVTSRGTTPMAIQHACGAPDVVERIGVLRTYPIRVGGNSGPLGKELTWDQVNAQAFAACEESPGGSHPDYRPILPERTTVSNRERRVFEFLWHRLAHVVRVCRPTCWALTFADYLDMRVLGQRDEAGLTQPVRDFISKIEDLSGVPVRIVRTGPLLDDCLVREP